MFAFGQDFEDELHTSGVFGYGRLKLELLTIGLVFNKGVGQPDLLDATAGDDRAVIHVV